MKLHAFTYDRLVYDRKGKIATLTCPIQIVLNVEMNEMNHSDNQSITIQVAPGFKWNGNSGAFPCRFSKDNEEYNVAILTHDVLYHRVGLSKADADDILRGMLREAGYSRFMAGLIHRAVTLFGRCAYNDDDQMTLENLDYITILI